MSSSGSGGGGGGGGGASNSPFAWLGLLKWSLAYSDGTRPTGDIQPMSKEDIEFLDKVMKEGIIDEGERMKEILKDLTDSLEGMLGLPNGGDGSVGVGCDYGGDSGNGEEKRKELDEEEMIELMQELRDIVEQIDYARAFMAMGGIPFLLGCATSGSVPKSIRQASLSILATMCQNNPPVQLSLLEHGHMPPLIQLFFDFSPNNGEREVDDSMREKVVQTLSCSVRGHSMAEHIFCQNEQGRLMLQMGLGMPLATSTSASESSSESSPLTLPSTQLRKRCLFLLRALLTSDDANDSRIKPFASTISYVATNEIDDQLEKEAEIREMSLQMLTQLVARAKTDPDHNSLGAQIISRYKSVISTVGNRRMNDIRSMEEGSEEKECAMMELEEWKQFLAALAEANPSSSATPGDAGEGNFCPPRFMICPRPPT